MIVWKKCRTVDVVGLFVGGVLIADGNGGIRNTNIYVCMCVCVCVWLFACRWCRSRLLSRVSRILEYMFCTCISFWDNKFTVKKSKIYLF